MTSGRLEVTAIDCTRDIVDAALWLARAFAEGRRLAVWAPGADDHAHHVAVEFVHPVVVGARSLPAVAVSTLSGVRSGDALLAIGDTGPSTSAETMQADLRIAASADDVEIVRTYHVLWELVQIALEHRGLVGSVSTSVSATGDSTGFLYPFLDAAPDDEVALRDALARSAEAKSIDSARSVGETLRSNTSAICDVAAAIADAAHRRGCVYTMGNGGSAGDAARLARLLGSLGVDTVSLVDDYAVLTAIANDVGVDRIFTRHLDALARRGDILIGCSTSGASPNILAAFRAAHSKEMTTIGVSGYGGESFGAEPAIRHRLTVDSSSVHRIQEAQAALMAELCDAVAHRLGTGRNETAEGRNAEGKTDEGETDEGGNAGIDKAPGHAPAAVAAAREPATT